MDAFIVIVPEMNKNYTVNHKAFSHVTLHFVSGIKGTWYMYKW